MIAWILLSVLHEVSTTCFPDTLLDPFTSKPGDFIISGMFLTGESYQLSDNNTKCEKLDKWALQRALVAREVIEAESSEFEKETGHTLGYEFYDPCKNLQLAIKTCVKITSSSNIVGFVGPPTNLGTKFIEDVMGVVASDHIPAFTYMYNDESLIHNPKYSTYFSLIDTEENEAKVVIHFLEKMQFQYVDIWYSPLSADVARYIRSYILNLEFGCGHFGEIGDDFQADITETYRKSGGVPAATQLLLFNNRTLTKNFLIYTINGLGWNHKTFIFGASIGREKYHRHYIDAIPKSTNKDITFIFPIVKILNTELQYLNNNLRRAWTGVYDRDTIADRAYKRIQKEEGCGVKNDCDVTSFNPFVATGIKILLRNIKKALISNNASFCATDFREQVYRSIIQENVSYYLELDNEAGIDVVFINKTLAIPVQIQGYQSLTGQYNMIGEASPLGMTVEDNNYYLHLIKSSRQTCSVNCLPGYYRAWNSFTQLPCCWSCFRCDKHKYSNSSNADSCDSCLAHESSDPSGTYCISVENVFMSTQSPLFIGFAGGTILMVVFIITLFCVILKNENRIIIKDSNPIFLYILLTGLTMGFLTSLAPILKPSPQSCAVEYILYTIATSIITSSVCWRCADIRLQQQDPVGLIKPRYAVFMGMKGLIFGTILILVINLACALCLHLLPGYGWFYQELQVDLHLSKYLMCAFPADRKKYFTFLPMVLPMISFTISLYLAFDMRNISYNFGEMSHIFAAVSVVFFACVMFVSGYSLAETLVQPMLRSVVVFGSCLAILVCIFVPKLTIILRNKDSGQGRETDKATTTVFTRNTERTVKSADVIENVYVSSKSSVIGITTIVGNR